MVAFHAAENDWGAQLMDRRRKKRFSVIGCLRAHTSSPEHIGAFSGGRHGHDQFHPAIDIAEFVSAANVLDMTQTKPSACGGALASGANLHLRDVRAGERV